MLSYEHLTACSHYIIIVLSIYISEHVLSCSCVIGINSYISRFSTIVIYKLEDVAFVYGVSTQIMPTPPLFKYSKNYDQFVYTTKSLLYCRKHTSQRVCFVKHLRISKIKRLPYKSTIKLHSVLTKYINYTIIWRSYWSHGVWLYRMPMKMFWIVPKAVIPWPPMIIVKIWQEAIVITNVCWFHMITWKSRVVYIIFCRMIKIRKTYTLKLLAIFTSRWF